MDNSDNKKGPDYHNILNIITVLRDSYHHCKMVLYEEDNCLAKYDDVYVRNCRRIVSRFERVCARMPDKEKLIIENEVLNNNMGSKWYLDFFSAPSYYVYKNKAYSLFLDLANK